jgi:hypothetical protein
MGNYFSNKKAIINDPSLVVCDAKQLQRRILNRSNDARIIKIVEKIPYACNCKYDPCTSIAQIPAIFETYYSCNYPLWFQVGTLRFCSDCKIVLTKKHYAEILELEKSKIVVPLSKDDQMKMLSWTSGNNYFL